MPRNQRPFGGTSEVATPSRRDERSGLLDIRTLSSIVESQQRARVSHASASSLALPTFSSSWGLQDVSVPAPAPSRPAAPKAAVADQRPLYMMVLVLSAAVASLGAFVALRPSPTVVVERTVAPMSAAAVTPEEPEESAEPEPEPEAPVAVAAPLDEGPEEAEAAEPEAKTKRPRGTRPRNHKPRPTPPTETKPVKQGGAIPIECVIDPSKCSRTGKKKTGDDGGETSTKGLPASPSSSQIRSAMSEVKPQAKACRSSNGGKSGEKVRVKLSVKGSTGKITSANALDDHAGTALGRCVANALGKATLPRFSKPQVGVVYAVTL